MSKRVVLSYPFSGSLYAFLDDQLCPGYGGYRRIGNSYYRTLYGLPDEQLTDLTLSLFVLFDEVVMVAADTALPDHKTYDSDGDYRHPDLGLVTSWERYSKAREEHKERIERDIRDPKVNEILARVPVSTRNQIIRDVRHELQLSLDFDCPILCSRGRKQLLRRLSELDAEESGIASDPQASQIQQVTRYFRIVGPIFQPPSLDALEKVKRDTGVRDYASHFVEIMLTENGPKDDEEFAQLLEESMKRADALEKRAGFFATGSRGLSAAGLFLGPIPSAGALAADYAAEKTRQALAKAKWYEFGPQVKKAATLAEIKRHLKAIREA